MVVPGLLIKAVLAVTPLLLVGAGPLPAAPPPAVVAPPVARPAAGSVPAQPASLAPPVPPPAPAPGCRPAQVFDLTNWKVTLPLPKPDNAAGPLEILQPQLATFTQPVFFRANSTCDAILFQAPVNGVTTSGSKYPRSELREMTDGGAGLASWSSGAGEHRMTVSEAFTHLPLGKPELVGAQIHDNNDDITVIRLEGSNLWITEGDNPHHKLITDQYKLGTRFEVTYDVSGGKIRVFYNGALQTTISDRFRNAYFKTGAYTQANCTNSPRCAADNYGETAVYNVTTFHHVTTGDLIWDWIFTWVPPVLLLLVVLVIAYRLLRRFRSGRGTGRHERGRP
jgi:hypothetical protein